MVVSIGYRCRYKLSKCRIRNVETRTNLMDGVRKYRKGSTGKFSIEEIVDGIDMGKQSKPVAA